MLKFPSAGLTGFLDGITASLVGCKIRLYKNNVTPNEASVLGDFTQCDFSGYAEQALPAFGAAVYNAPAAEATAAPVTWIHNGGATDNDIYGYYVVTAGGAYVYGERYAGAPFNITSGGAFIVVPYQSLINQT